jgi:predicted nucleic acid-binding protein
MTFTTKLSLLVLACPERRSVARDDYRARKLAKAEGLEIFGSVGLLETFYLRRYLTDLRIAFRQLLVHNVYIDQRLLDRRLRSLGLPAL